MALIKAIVAAGLFLPLGTVIAIGFLAALIEVAADYVYLHMHPWYTWAWGE
jgi:hypothetical protein